MGWGRLLPWFCFFSPALCLSRPWKHEENSWNRKMWNLGCPTAKKIILLQTQSFWRSGTSWGWWCSSGVRSKGGPVPVVVHTLPTACTLVPLHGEPASPASMLPAWPRCAHLPALVGRMCLLQMLHPCMGQASREQDTVDRIFDLPALTLMWFSSQTIPVKAFLFTFTVFPPPFLKIFFQRNEYLACFSQRLRKNKIGTNPSYAIVSLSSTQPDRAKFSDPEHEQEWHSGISFALKPGEFMSLILAPRPSFSSFTCALLPSYKF